MKRMPPCYSLIVLLIVLLNKVEEVRGDCIQPMFDGNRILTSDSYKDVYPDGITVKVQCGPGYVTAEQAASKLSTCTGNTWTNPGLRCKGKSCGSPPDIENGNYVFPNGNLFGATIYGECNPGYMLVQNRTRNCDVAGWDGSAPICQVVSCSHPPIINNADREPSKDFFKYAEVVSYTCKHGFTLFGEDTISCSSDGTFKPSAPECLVIRCNEAEVIHAQRTSIRLLFYTYGDIMTFMCDPNYEMIGEKKIVCGKNEWNPAPPKCIGLCPKPQCGEHQVLTDGFNKDTYRDGTNVTCKCSLGYKPVDSKASSNRTCSNTQWTKLQLQCEKKQCPHVLEFPNGKYTYPEGLLFEAKSLVQCNEGYKLEKPVSRTCQDAGWDGQQPVCIEIKCDHPVVKHGHITNIEKQIYSYGEKLTFECNKGYKTDDPKEITCRNNGWQPPPPRCSATDNSLKTILLVVGGILLTLGSCIGGYYCKTELCKRRHFGGVSTKNEEENL